jgi:ABC-type transport system involved in multi-copper enzyme maturation permease subunit
LRLTALLGHYLGRSRWAGLAAVSGALLFQVLVIAGWLNFQRSGAASAAPVLRRSMPRWLQSAFGIEGAQVGELTTFLTLAAQHPFLLLLVMALPMAMVTAFLAGDSEKRTLALILSRPVGRLAVVLVAALATALRLLLVILASLVGVWIGSRLLPPESTIQWHAVFMVHGNLLLLGLATLGLSLWPAILAQTRGGALGACVAVGILSYALHFVVQMLPVIRPLGRLSLFQYYNPGQTLLLGRTATADLWILAAVTIVTVAGAAVVFRKRDLAL